MLLSGVVFQQKLVCSFKILGFWADPKLIKEGDCKIRMRALIAWSCSTVFQLHGTFIRCDVTSIKWILLVLQTVINYRFQKASLAHPIFCERGNPEKSLALIVQPKVTRACSTVSNTLL